MSVRLFPDLSFQGLVGAGVDECIGPVGWTGRKGYKLVHAGQEVDAVALLGLACEDLECPVGLVVSRRPEVQGLGNVLGRHAVGSNRSAISSWQVLMSTRCVGAMLWAEDELGSAGGSLPILNRRRGVLLWRRTSRGSSLLSYDSFLFPTRGKCSRSRMSLSTRGSARPPVQATPPRT